MEPSQGFFFFPPHRTECDINNKASSEFNPHHGFAVLFFFLALFFSLSKHPWKEPDFNNLPCFVSTQHFEFYPQKKQCDFTSQATITLCLLPSVWGFGAACHSEGTLVFLTPQPCFRFSGGKLPARPGSAGDKRGVLFLWCSQTACRLPSMWPSRRWKPTLPWWHGTSLRETPSSASPSRSR